MESRQLSTTQSPTTTTTTTTTPQVRKSMLLNYQFPALQQIPRTALRFAVEPVPGHENTHDCEIITIDPLYNSLMSSDYQDRAENQHFRYQSQLRYLDDFRIDSSAQQAHDIRAILERYRIHNQLIHDTLDNQNENLRRLQLQLFIERIESGEPAHGSEDERLNSAFLFAANSVGENMDLRSSSTRLLIEASRRLQCTYHGRNIIDHARLVGAPGIPNFRFLQEVGGYTRFSEEEIDWMRFPTDAWYPRPQDYRAELTRAADEEDMAASGDPYPADQIYFGMMPSQRMFDLEPFAMPTYHQAYNEIRPALGARDLSDSRNAHDPHHSYAPISFEESLHESSNSDSSSNHEDYGSDDDSTEYTTPRPPRPCPPQFEYKVSFTGRYREELRRRRRRNLDQNMITDVCYFTAHDGFDLHSYLQSLVQDLAKQKI